MQYNFDMETKYLFALVLLALTMRVILYIKRLKWLSSDDRKEELRKKSNHFLYYVLGTLVSEGAITPADREHILNNKHTSLEYRIFGYQIEYHVSLDFRVRKAMKKHCHKFFKAVGYSASYTRKKNVLISIT